MLDFTKRRIYNRLLKFSVVGVIQNGFGYLLYLTLTLMPVNEKFVLIFTYALGVYISIKLNQRYTFSHNGVHELKTGAALSVYISALILNIILHFLLVDLFQYDHRIVQFGCIFVVALYIFLILNFISR